MDYKDCRLFRKIGLVSALVHDTLWMLFKKVKRRPERAQCTAYSTVVSRTLQDLPTGRDISSIVVGTRRH